MSSTNNIIRGNHKKEEVRNQELLDLIHNATTGATTTVKKKVDIVWQLKDGNSFGFRTTTIWISILRLFFDEIFEVERFVIDESRMDKYRFNGTHSLYSGFFHPRKDVVTSVVDSGDVDRLNDGITTFTPTIVTGQLDRWEYTLKTCYTLPVERYTTPPPSAQFDAEDDEEDEEKRLQRSRFGENCCVSRVNLISSTCFSLSSCIGFCFVVEAVIVENMADGLVICFGQ